MRPLNKLVLVCYFLLPSIALADARQLLAERLKSLQTMSASFQQTTASEQGDVISTSLGTLMLASGGRFHIETVTPFVQRLIADGTDLYSFDEDLNQVIVKPLVQDIKQVPILLFGNANQDFLRDYEVTQQNKQQENVEHLFVLRPQVPDSVFLTLTLQFDGDTPVQLSLIDSLGQMTHIDFSEVQINKPIPQEVFEYQISPGVDLIDDR